MHSFVTSKNVKWRRLIWAILHVSSIFVEILDIEQFPLAKVEAWKIIQADR